MNNNMTVRQIQGLAYFAKLSKPVQNYQRDGEEWSIDVALTPDTVKELKALGLDSKIRPQNEKHDNLPYITFRRATVKRAGPNAGQENSPIRVVSPDGKTPWDTSVLIGNGSVVNVKFAVHSNPAPKGKGVNTRADILSIQVWQHKPFVPGERSEFDANSEALQQAANDSW